MSYQIIREVRKPNEHTATTRCVVRTNCYASSMKFLQELVAAAREDFPDLNGEDMDVKYYGGRRYARTFGIEFNVTDVERVPARYRDIHEVEFTL